MTVSLFFQKHEKINDNKFAAKSTLYRLIELAVFLLFFNIFCVSLQSEKNNKFNKIYALK